jgi:hypothetical protein
MRRKVSAACALTLAAVTGLAAVGCGSQPKLTGSMPAGGHQSAIAAVAGFFRGLQTGNPIVACDYVDPGEKGNCYGTFGNVGAASGSWRVGRSVVSGSEAIVVVELADFCLNGQCTTAASPDKGLPGPRTAFKTAFDQTQQPGARKAPFAIGCVEIGARWYLEVPVEGLI